MFAECLIGPAPVSGLQMGAVIFIKEESRERTTPWCPALQFTKSMVEHGSLEEDYEVTGMETLCRLQRHRHLAWYSILPLIRQVTALCYTRSLQAGCLENITPPHL